MLDLGCGTGRPLAECIMARNHQSATPSSTTPTPPAKALEIVAQAGFRILMAEFTNLPTGGRDKGKFAIIAERRRQPDFVP